jgi:hypothetical protein
MALWPLHSRDSREQTSFGDTQEDTCDEQARETLDETHANHNDTGKTSIWFTIGEIELTHPHATMMRGSHMEGLVSISRCPALLCKRTHLQAFITMLLGTSKRT